MARARLSGSSDLKIPLPTNTASAPSCITSAASAGVAIPPAEKFGTGSLPLAATHSTSSSGAPRFLDSCTSSSRPSTVSCFISFTMVRMWRTASTILPEPASPFVRIIAARAAYERHFVIPLVDVVLFVGGRQYFAFVDVIDTQRFQHAGFGEVADAGL